MVVHKIGIVPLARVPDGVRVLIHKPLARDGETDIAWGLARGTRMYRDAGGQWVDARDRAQAEAHKDRLEAPVDTALREMEEELDVQEAEIALIDIGVLDYASVQQGAYPIHWFSGWVEDVARARRPADAVAVQWVGRDLLGAMAARGEFKESYLPVVDAILARMGA